VTRTVRKKRCGLLRWDSATRATQRYDGTVELELDDADPSLVETARTAVFLTFCLACSMTPDVAVLTLHHVVAPVERVAADVTSLQADHSRVDDEEREKASVSDASIPCRDDRSLSSPWARA
jgi:hypothetical protein